MRLARRALLLGAGALACSPANAAGDAFQSFLQSLWPQAQNANVSRATFERAFASLTPDPRLMGSGIQQAEFERTIEQYINSAVSDGRAAKGRALMQRWSNELHVIEQRIGVPASIILATWGLETDFGSAHGDRDVVRSLATLAYTRKDNQSFVKEVIAALVMLERGLVTRDKFKGSWAGAMGHPQFMPSAYLKHGLSYAGSAAPDIWASVPDALASIANFLMHEGWQRTLPWGCEVDVPNAFDWTRLNGTVRDFTTKSVTPMQAIQPSAQVSLFAPAGAQGPAVFITANFFVLKQYNNSDSYALALSLLSERIAGRPALKHAWPKPFTILPREDRVKVQQLLAQHKFYEGKIDGRFGPSSRLAIHQFQRAAGLHPADGFASRTVLQALIAYR